MFKKNRCYICGAKLRNGYCDDCGLDVAHSSHIHYRLNASTRVVETNANDDERLKRNKEQRENHVPQQHTFQEQNVFLEKEQQKKPGFRSTIKQTKKPVRWVKVLIAVIVAFSVIGGIIEEYRETHYYISDHTSSIWDQEEEEEYDPYAYVTRELSEDGEDFEIELGQGIYEVGVHLPEGFYTVELQSGISTMNLDDDENFIYYWEYFGDDAEQDEITKLEDLRMYQGAELEITGQGILRFTTESGQTDQMETLVDNPLTEVIHLSTNTTMTEGEDFQAGIYDVAVEQDWTVLKYGIPSDSEYAEDGFDTYSLWLDEEEGPYRNVVLPAGCVISTEDEDVILTPSEKIASKYIE